MIISPQSALLSRHFTTRRSQFTKKKKLLKAECYLMFVAVQSCPADGAVYAYFSVLRHLCPL